MIKVRRKIQFVTRERGRLALAAPPHEPMDVQRGRIPRVTRLIALAIHFDRLIREGKVKDISELARLAHVTQPRMTQIMNLNHLAPDIQQQILFLPPIEIGRCSIHEKLLRPIAATPDWRIQRRMWAESGAALAPVKL
jgi:hypothetical protein